MKVYGASAYDVDMVVTDVSRDRYEDNLIVKSLRDYSTSRGGRATYGLQVVDSHAGKRGAIGVPGHRGAGPRGLKRRSGAACWHAHWDVVEELLRRFPAASIVGGLRLRDKAVRYTRDTFTETALTTAHLNVGWADKPVTMPQCCECDHTRYTDVEPYADPDLSDPAYRRVSTVPSWMPGSRAMAGQRIGIGIGTGTGHRGTGHRGSSAGMGWYTQSNASSPNTARPYLDGLPAATPWVPGSATVAGTLALIDQVTSEDKPDE